MSIPTIQLDTGTTGSGVPAVKFPSIGSKVVVGIVNIEEYQQYKDDVPQVWERDGSPKMGKRVYGLVVSTVPGDDGQGPTVKDNDQDRPVEPGELVTFYCEGGRHYTWKDAVTAADGAFVGDVMQWAFVEQKPPAKPTHTGQKVYQAQIRRPEARDGDLPTRCVEAYQQLQQGPQLQAAAPTAQTQQAPAHLEEPF